MTNEEALKRLYDCAECHSAEFYPHMADLEAYNTVENALKRIDSIEKELGLDLDTLLRAFKDGIWYKEENGEIARSCNLSLTNFPWELNPLEGRVYAENSTGCATVSLSAYGKTWALTKKELEEEE